LADDSSRLRVMVTHQSDHPGRFDDVVFRKAANAC
jgi:hypothetical protein